MRSQNNGKNISGQWCCLSVREWVTAVEREHCLPLCHAPDDLAQATVAKIWLYCACYSWVSVLQTSTIRAGINL